MKNKLVFIILTIITVINIIFIIYGFITDVSSPHSFNVSLDTAHNITIFVIITLLLQVLNLVMIKVGKKKNIIIIIAIIIITFFIPVKCIESVKYNYERHVIDFVSSTTYNSEYKNIYGITLTTNKYTHKGMDMY